MPFPFRVRGGPSFRGAGDGFNVTQALHERLQLDTNLLFERAELNVRVLDLRESIECRDRAGLDRLA